MGCPKFLHCVHFAIHMFLFVLLTLLDPYHYIKNDVFLDYNMKASHILCLNETHFNPQTSNIISFIDPKQHSSISVYIHEMAQW
jgi:hypothetical protein